MTEKDQIREHMEVVSSDGLHVGTVDCVQRSTIVLTKSDPASGGSHHDVPLDWLSEVKDNKVHLTQTAEEIRRNWLPSAKGGCR